jgi:hypothetical protein
MLIKKILVSTFILASTISLSYAQTFDFKSIDIIVFDMAEYNIYETEKIGFAAAKSKQYQNYIQLQEKATDEQLLDLAANHDNAVVRLYSLQALHHRKITIPELLAEKFKNDTTSVTVQQGCIRSIRNLNYLASVTFY